MTRPYRVASTGGAAPGVAFANGGNGGNGGAGLSASSITIENSGTISGGNGGAGHSSNGAPGAGGVGVIGAGLPSSTTARFPAVLAALAHRPMPLSSRAAPIP
jgi:hypothetical protein